VRVAIEIMRPHQWVKNVFVFAGFIFAGRLRWPLKFMLPDLLGVISAFAIFCFLSSAVYIINDILDMERDRAHPQKQYRPLPSGRMSVKEAWVLAVGLAIGSLLAASLLSWARGAPLFAAACGAYFTLMMVYSLALRNIAIVDVLAIAVGFVLRVVAGCWVLPVEASPWLVVCTLLLALFMALCKRRHELLALGDDAARFRGVLPEYSPGSLDQMISIAGASTLIAYSLYTFTAPHMAALGRESPLLMVTIPFVAFGLFRYLQLCYRTDVAVNPEALFSDRPMMINLALWVITILLLTSLGGPGLP